MNNTPCRYFQSASGCRFGEMCRFSHSKESKPSTTTLCRFFNSIGGCRYGKNCFYKHDKQDITKCIPIINKNVEEIKPKPDDKDELIVFGYIRGLIKLLEN